MSATIEERVVAMKFDNSNFEKNVKTSMSTLDKLKEALNFNSAKDSVKTLNEATKSVDFSKMANSIDTISDRFSALGVVGMSVLNNLTNKATDAALNILSKVPSMIIEGGWKRASDVEQGRFTLQGLVDDAETVEALMAAARESVNETAYAANEAIKAASVFAASGVTDAEKMQYVLKGVAGVAATTNSNYEDIARIFETVSGQGRIMGEQLNQLAVRGLNAAAVLANYYGTTEAEIRDLVSQGEVSFDLFSEAMTETFGEHAKDANKTFTGSMANIRAALARTGEAFFKYLIEQEGPAVQLFNAIRIKINEMNNAWAPAAKSAAEAVNKIIDSFRGLVEQIPMINITNTLINAFKTLINILRPFGQIISSIGSAFGQAFDFGRTSDMIYRFSVQVENFTRNLALSEDTVKGITKVFKGFFDIIAAVGDVIFEFIGSIKIAEVPFQSFTDIIGRFLGGIGDILTDISLTIRRSTGLKNAFSKLADTLNKFGEVISSIFRIVVSLFSDLVSISGEATEGIGEFVGAFVSRGIEIFATVLEKVVDLLELFRKNILVPGLEAFTVLILSAAEALEEFFYGIRKSERIQKAFGKISSAMERLFTAVKNVFKPLTDIFSDFHINARQASESVGGFLASLAIDAVTVFVEALAKVVEFLEKVAEKFVIPALDIFIENVGKATGKMVEFAETHSFTDVLDGIKEKLGAVAEGFKGFFGSLDENDGILYRAVEGLKKMYENFKLLQGGASAHTLYDEETGEFIEIVDEVSEKESIISKIGNAFKTFGENVKDAMEKAYEAVKNFISYIFNTDPKQMAEDIKESLIKLKDKLSELIDKFKIWAGVTGESAEGIKVPFEGARTAIKNFFTELDTDKIIAVIFTGVMIALLVSILRMTNAFTGLIKGVTTLIDGFKKVTGSISGFFKSITNPFKKSKIVEFAEAILLVAAAIAILTLVDQSKLWSAVGAISAIATVIVALTAVLALVASALKKKEAEEMFKRLSKMIVSLALSVLILTAAVKILENVDFRKSQKAVLVIAELAAVMIAASLVLTRFAKGGLKGFLVLLGFAVVIGKVAKALKTIADINFKNIQENLEGFAVAIGGLALVAFAASNMRLTSGIGLLIFTYALEKVLPMLNDLALEVNVQNILNLIRDNIDLVYQIGGLVAAMIVVQGIFGKGIRKFGTGMILLGIATALMVHAIKTIAGIDQAALEQGAKVLTGIMVMFGILSIIFQLSDGENHAIRIAAAIGILSLALYPIAGAIWILGTIDTDKAKQGLIAVSVIMGMFALITWAASSGTNSTSIWTMIIITLAVVALMGEMIALTFIPYEQIQAAARSMALVMVAFGAVLYACGKIFKIHPTVIITIIELAALTVLLAYEIYKLSTQPWQGMLAAGVGLAAVILALAESVKIMGTTDWKAAIGNALDVFLLSLSLYPIAGALWLLRDVDWKSMLAASVGFRLVVLGLARSVDIMNDADWKKGVGNALDLFLLSLSLYPIAGAIWLLRNMNWKTMIGASISFSLLVVALGAAVRIMNKVDWKSAIRGAAACFILAVACIPIAVAINQLRGFRWQDMIAAAAALVIVLGGMTAITEVLSVFRVNAGAAIKGAFVVVAVAAILIGLTSALAGLAGWLIDDDMAGYIERGLDLLIMIAGKLGDAIGAFIGGIIGGAGMKILEDIGIGLELFSYHANVFTEWAKTIDESVVDGVAALAKALLIFGLSELIESVARFLGLGSISNLPNQMTLMGNGLKAFEETTTGINYESTTGALELATALFSIHPPRSGGFVGWIVGNNDLKNFNPDALGESGFAGGLKAFAEAVEGLELSKVEGGLAVADALFKLDPPNDGGFVSVFTGENALKKFNRRRLGDNENGTGFGGGLKAFAEAVEGIEYSQVSGAIKVAKALFELDPPNDGGLVSVIVGENALKKFNKKRLGDNEDGTGFGGGLKAFVEAVDGITYDQVDGAIKVADALFKLDPPNEGGLIAIIIGDNKFSKFNAKRLGEEGLGGGIAAFCKSVEGLTSENLEGANTAAETLKILTSIEVPDNKGGLFDWLDKLLTGDNNNFALFNETLSNLGGGLGAFYNSIKDIDMDIVKNGESVLYNLAGSMYHMKGIDFGKVDEFVDAVGRIGKDAIDEFCKAFKTAKDKTDKAFEIFMNQVKRSIHSNKKIALTEMTDFSDEMLNTYTSQVGSYNTAGVDNSASYIEGFMSNQDYANFNMEEFANGNYESLIGENGFDVDGDYSNMFGDLGQLNYDSYMDSFMSNQDYANFNMEQFAQGNLDAIMGQNGFDINGDISKAMEEIGSISADSLIDGLGDISSYANLGSIENSAKTAIDKINSKFDAEINYDKFKQRANDIVQGLSNGMDAYSYIAENSARSLASRIAERFSNYNQINSPSKLYAGFGRYIDEGLSVGIDDYASEPVEAIGNVGNSMYDSLRNAMDETANYISENMDVNPTITPYVDITGAMRDVDALNSMFDDTALAYDMQSKFGDMALGSIKDIDATNSDVVSAISNLRSDVASIMNVVGNLKVYMDSGTLVGEIAPGMDNALGQMAMMKRRGV